VNLTNIFIISPPPSSSFNPGVFAIGRVRTSVNPSLTFTQNYNVSLTPFPTSAFLLCAFSSSVSIRCTSISHEFYERVSIPSGGDTFFGFEVPSALGAPVQAPQLQDAAPSDNSGIAGPPAWIGAAIVVPLVVIISGAILLAVLLIRRRKRQDKSTNGTKNADVEMQNSPSGKGKEGNYVSIGPEKEGGQYAAIDATTQTRDADERMRRTVSAVQKKKKNWEIPFEELRFQKELGSGAFGSVWKGKWFDTDVAIKQSLLVSATSASQADFETEAKV
jgi:hypothetical protein